jgi:hypothetical protein
MSLNQNQKKNLAKTYAKNAIVQRDLIVGDPVLIDVYSGILEGVVVGNIVAEDLSDIICHALVLLEVAEDTFLKAGTIGVRKLIKGPKFKLAKIKKKATKKKVTKKKTVKRVGATAKSSTTKQSRTTKPLASTVEGEASNSTAIA